MAEGMLLVVSGPSGAGKSTVLNAVMQQRQDMFFSVSATTRKPREGEQEGVHYYFREPDAFQDMIQTGKLLEWAEFAGNCYGTPIGPVLNSMKQGHIVVLDVETEGAMAVMEKYPDAVSVFLTPSSAQEVERRLRKRGTETEETIRRRMKINQKGHEYINRYTYVVVNDTLEDAIHQMQSILLAEQSKTRRQPGLFAEYRK